MFKTLLEKLTLEKYSKTINWYYPQIYVHIVLVSFQEFDYFVNNTLDSTPPPFFVNPPPPCTAFHLGP